MGQGWDEIMRGGLQDGWGSAQLRAAQVALDPRSAASPIPPFVEPSENATIPAAAPSGFCPAEPLRMCPRSTRTFRQMTLFVDDHQYLLSCWDHHCLRQAEVKVYGSKPAYFLWRGWEIPIGPGCSGASGGGPVSAYYVPDVGVETEAVLDTLDEVAADLATEEDGGGEGMDGASEVDGPVAEDGAEIPPDVEEDQCYERFLCERDEGVMDEEAAEEAENAEDAEAVDEAEEAEEAEEAKEAADVESPPDPQPEEPEVPDPDAPQPDAVDESSDTLDATDGDAVGEPDGPEAETDSVTDAGGDPLPETMEIAETADTAETTETDDTPDADAADGDEVVVYSYPPWAGFFELRCYEDATMQTAIDQCQVKQFVFGGEASALSCELLFHFNDEAPSKEGIVVCYHPDVGSCAPDLPVKAWPIDTIQFFEQPIDWMSFWTLFEGGDGIDRGWVKFVDDAVPPYLQTAIALYATAPDGTECTHAYDMNTEQCLTWFNKKWECPNNP